MTDDELQEFLDDWENLGPGDQARIRRIVMARNKRRLSAAPQPQPKGGSIDYGVEMVSVHQGHPETEYAPTAPQYVSPEDSIVCLGAYADEGCLADIRS